MSDKSGPGESGDKDRILAGLRVMVTEGFQIGVIRVRTLKAVLIQESAHRVWA